MVEERLEETWLQQVYTLQPEGQQQSIYQLSRDVNASVYELISYCCTYLPKRCSVRVLTKNHLISCVTWHTLFTNPVSNAFVTHSLKKLNKDTALSPGNVNTFKCQL